MLFDHLVGGSVQRQRNSEAQRFRGLGLMNGKNWSGINQLSELMLLLPNAATSLEIQLLVWVWANDSPALRLGAR
jgi:hypothetical protein